MKTKIKAGCFFMFFSLHFIFYWKKKKQKKKKESNYKKFWYLFSRKKTYFLKVDPVNVVLVKGLDGLALQLQ